MLYFFMCFSFFLGIITWDSPTWENIIGFSLIIIIFTLLSFQKYIYKIITFFMVFCIGFSLSHNAHNDRIIHKNFLENITQNFSEKYEITWEITKKLFQTDYRETYRLRIDSIGTSEKILKISDKNNIWIFVDIPKNLTLNTGDIISFQWKITAIYDDENIEDFEKYSWFHKIYGKSSLYTFKRIQTSEKNIFEKTQERVKTLIFNGFPENISALLLGITIWNTDLMTSEIKDDFQNASLTHILVVSGSNIAFLILFLEFFIKYFPIKKFWKYCIIFSFLGLYGSLVGWEIPVIRATIMGIISYLAISEWWKINSVSFLFLLAIIFSLFEPLSLLYDASFSLSFGATLGIIVFNKQIYDFLKKFLKISWICTIISVTLSATIGSLPAIIYHFGTIGFLGIFANILIGGIMGILLFATTLYILLSFFIPDSLLYFLGLPIYFIGEYIFLISDFFGQFKLYTISENIKIPLVTTLCFAGFIYILCSEEEKILNTK